MVLEETDKDVIEGCRQGESNAFRALFERYKDKVYTIALRYSGDASVAQDIAQETFLKLFAGIGNFRGDCSFDSWLYRVIVNSCFDQKRKTRRLMPLVDTFLDLMQAPGASVLDDVMRAEMSGHLRSVVAGLPSGERMLIVLRYAQGLSYEELGEVMGCSSGTIGSRLNRIHKLLEKRMLRLSGRNRV
ncbi:MAG: sigma-70 family RNA polymerase sigma factor [Bryobacteraceae bacterium]|jgi:RNA polymerase sigma-70 factor (ECF subfamily)